MPSRFSKSTAQNGLQNALCAPETRLRRDALAILKAGLKAADAGEAVRRHLRLSDSHLRPGPLRLPLNRFDRIHLVAIGKAAAPMAAAVEKILGVRLTGGIVVTKHGHASTRLKRLEVFESSHPVPDETGAEAALRVAQLARELNARDLLIVAVSGGASALLPAPLSPVTLAMKKTTTDQLLRAGADIFELNAVRKHLSALKGGRFAALAYPATVVGLLLSDVIGDPLDVIGSGLTAPDDSTREDALRILDKYEARCKIPAEVRPAIQLGPETPKPKDAIFNHVHNVIVGSNRLALAACATEAKARGYRTLVLSSTMQGETREIARAHAQILREVIASGNPVRPPACLLAGGETAVTVHGAGKGGRNQEFALATALELEGSPNCLVLSAGTDGTDGPTDAAGALASGDTIRRARLMDLDASKSLAENDSYHFFDALGDLIRTGPTGTNVMDIHLLLAGDRKS
ncbi:MAG TPA: glycerate kinase [Bryobacteraceae bacterium]|nr:glycerate kinase [Bryobacteraceae bacterium]